jgi:hypothetical protein
MARYDRGGHREFDERTWGRERAERAPRGSGRGYRGGRSWTGGYREGYQGGSEGVALNTTGRYYPGPEEAPLWSGGCGYDRGFREPGAARNRQRREPGEPAWRRLERWRPRYSPIGGMHPAMGGEFKYRGESHRGTGYDGWYNRRTRWF